MERNVGLFSSLVAWLGDLTREWDAKIYCKGILVRAYVAICSRWDILRLIHVECPRRDCFHNANKLLDYHFLANLVDGYLSDQTIYSFHPLASYSRFSRSGNRSLSLQNVESAMHGEASISFFWYASQDRERGKVKLGWTSGRIQVV